MLKSLRDPALQPVEESVNVLVGPGVALTLRPHADGLAAEVPIMQKYPTEQLISTMLVQVTRFPIPASAVGKAIPAPNNNDVALQCYLQTYIFIIKQEMAATRCTTPLMKAPTCFYTKFEVRCSFIGKLSLQPCLLQIRPYVKASSEASQRKPPLQHTCSKVR